MEALLISACLLGRRCKYDGGSNALPEATLEKLRARYRLVALCPETAGGLGVPREPCERRGEGVFSRSGADVGAAFRQGAAEALRLARAEHCRMALLKARSPSCGSGQIYDGSFSGRLIAGDGVAAALLKAAGIRVYDENQIEMLL